MALVAAGYIEHESFWCVHPATWQAGLSLSSRRVAPGESYEDRKRRFKSEAQALFPSVKVTKSIADALLLAHYCRLKCEGQL